MAKYKFFITLLIPGAVMLTIHLGAALAAPNVTATLIRTIQTSNFVPPSTDPADIAYLKPSKRLLVCDSEVEETSYFQGFNLFQLSLAGELLETWTTTDSATGPGYSDEPVGCAYNPLNGRLFISDDDQKKVFEIYPGPDGKLLTADDKRTVFFTSAFGNNDPEGLTFVPPQNALYIVDGLNSEVYKVQPGPDRLFHKTADNVINHFDTFSLGVEDPEGIAYEPNFRHLYLTGKPPKTKIAQITTSGTLVRMIDISAAKPVKPAGLTVAPGSLGTSDPTPKVLNLYISDRGVDNFTNPNQNDGKVYEFSIPDLPPGNQQPGVAAGPDQQIGMKKNCNGTLPPPCTFLNGTVTDDGLPNPPGKVTTIWRKISGPGKVTFANASAVDTKVRFSTSGSYVLRLKADDSALTRSDDVQISVRPDVSQFATLYLSTANAGIAGFISFENEDIITYDFATSKWSLYFDGSDVGLGATGVNLDAFYILPDSSILLSLDSDGIFLPNVGKIDDSDIVRFIPTSLGVDTAGTFTWYFDGSDVGLDSVGEDIDAISFLPDGRLIVSTVYDFAVDGLTGKDEDLIAFTPASLGKNTSGTWQMHFDGSTVGLAQSSEDVNGAWIDNNNGANSDIYLTVKGGFSVSGTTGGTVTGGGDDIFRCVPASTGAVTKCALYDFTWDGTGSGLPPGSDVDGLQFVPHP